MPVDISFWHPKKVMAVFHNWQYQILLLPGSLGNPSKRLMLSCVAPLNSAFPPSPGPKIMSHNAIALLDVKNLICSNSWFCVHPNRLKWEFPCRFSCNCFAKISEMWHIPFYKSLACLQTLHSSLNYTSTSVWQGMYYLCSLALPFTDSRPHKVLIIFSWMWTVDVSGARIILSDESFSRHASYPITGSLYSILLYLSPKKVK